MGFVLDYMQTLKSGSFRYRRRVPKHLVEVIRRGEILHYLGGSRKEALRAYQLVHREVERLFRQASLGSRAGPVSPRHFEGHEYEDHARLIAKMRSDGFDPYEDHVSIGQNYFRQQVADGLLDAYPVDPHDGEPEVPHSEADYIRALYNGPPPKPAPTLTDAMRLYLAENAGTDSPENHKKRQRVERVVSNAKNALGGDRKLTDINWHDARAVCAHLLALHKAPETTRRYLNDLMGVAAIAIKAERLGIPNPFAGIEVGKDPVQVKEGRQDVPESVLEEAIKAIRLRLQTHASPELLNIWTLLEHTGCRGKEVSGLAKDDVFLADTKHPYIQIKWTENRRLKSITTTRGIPLVPAARRAVEEAMREAGESAYLFPKYHSGQKGADRASAALMKHVRAVTKDPRIVTYSLRHLVKAKLLAAMVPDDMQERIMGHGGGKISRAYGLHETERAAMAAALSKIFPGP